MIVFENTGSTFAENIIVIMNLNELLNWRYATKSMNGEKVPSEKLERILDNIRLAASSGGVQPYNVYVIEDLQLREKIKAVAYNQQQITQASHLIVFAAWDNVTPERIDDFINQIAKTRDVSVESLSGMRGMVSGFLQKTPAENATWAAKQAYIALGFALIAAAHEQVDATPMEGFENAKLDEVLGLNEKGLKSAVIMTLGYRDHENDWLVKLPKVRTDKDKLFVRL